MGRARQSNRSGTGDNEHGVRAFRCNDDAYHRWRTLEIEARGAGTRWPEIAEQLSGRIAGRIAHEAFVPQGDGWVDRTLQRLARVVTVRRALPC